MRLDKIDRKLLNLVQEKFPLLSEPYRKLGEIIGISEGEVLARLKQMQDEGVIRRLGAVFESRKLGYSGTLCAMRVEPDRVDEVAAIINSFPGVTHNYLREHQINIWFTVLAGSEDELGEILNLMREKTGIREIMELPAEEVFKIKVNFSLS
ncbi:AsnC family transcriptional regulator [Pelotomaculum terephthalicicum JT]|uniref:siroheme decarboxylase subunit alpha n=1 Tax=Pelotomaculum TaxID=191373 RepID=UPI0009CA96EA|nr:MULTISPECIES: AsnC family transcriptional regulator [Pelotomaculum]MCG9967604.1 AsnC family transcriptional regulator [Pelotomaculum terephthalicicum JT]OPX91663.1 MAG: DNA-binding transcriptional regulator AsnC [Pelotomaculum sp. PtaB.Bin117]OPY61835.1 MAG: DNA-binding transcriptional regulator AsnC [Pelotomaculum sp. PtaU1.Bin065]